MGPLGFVIPSGILLALIVAMAKSSKKAEAAPSMPPQPDDAPPPVIPPMGPESPEDYGQPTEDYGQPSDYAQPPIPPSMPPGIPPEMLPPEDRPPIVHPPIETPGLPPSPPVMETPSGPVILKSPIKNVNDRQWSKFIQRMARGKEGTITSGARYGLFLFGVRRLADLGLVTNVKRGTYQGQTVWTGTWKPPYSEAMFLESSRLQYQAFVKSTMEYAGKYTAARKQRPDIFHIANKPLTMSGFLAFAHVAGFQGAIKSLKERKVRPETLQFVNLCNGIF